jgi:hypothetical protein
MNTFVRNILQNHLQVTYPNFFIHQVKLQVDSKVSIYYEGFLLIPKLYAAQKDGKLFPIFIQCNEEIDNIRILTKKLQISNFTPSDLIIYKEDWEDITNNTKTFGFILFDEKDFAKLEENIHIMLQTYCESESVSASLKADTIDEWLSIFSI